MGNRGMAGFFDKPEPGWEERAMARVHARQKKSRAGRRTHGMNIFFEPQLRVYLDAAAHKRGITMNGYVRRAIMALLSHDLGLPLEEIGQHMPGAGPYGQRNPSGINHKGYDDAKGYGPWNIEGLK